MYSARAVTAKMEDSASDVEYADESDDDDEDEVEDESSATTT